MDKRKNQAFDAHILHILHINCIPQTLSKYIFLFYMHAQNLICFHYCEPKLRNIFLYNIKVSQDQHQFNNMDAMGLIIYVKKSPQLVQIK
jgi:hypothetical protein